MPENGTCDDLASQFIGSSCPSYLAEMRGSDCSFASQYTPINGIITNGDGPMGWGTILSLSYNILSTLIAAGFACAYSRKRTAQVQTVETETADKIGADGTKEGYKKVKAQLVIHNDHTDARSMVNPTKFKNSTPASPVVNPLADKDMGGLPSTPAVQREAVKGVLERIDKFLNAETTTEMDVARLELITYVYDPAQGAVRDMMKRALISASEASHVGSKMLDVVYKIKAAKASEELISEDKKITDKILIAVNQLLEAKNNDELLAAHEQLKVIFSSIPADSAINLIFADNGESIGGSGSGDAGYSGNISLTSPIGSAIGDPKMLTPAGAGVGFSSPEVKNVTGNIFSDEHHDLSSKEHEMLVDGSLSNRAAPILTTSMADVGFLTLVQARDTKKSSAAVAEQITEDLSSPATPAPKKAVIVDVASALLAHAKTAKSSEERSSDTSLEHVGVLIEDSAHSSVSGNTTVFSSDH